MAKSNTVNDMEEMTPVKTYPYTDEALNGCCRLCAEPKTRMKKKFSGIRKEVNLKIKELFQIDIASQSAQI